MSGRISIAHGNGNGAARASGPLGSSRNGRSPGRAWIRRIRLINWHGHENATLDVLGDMLAIIGENGSGKSLILDAIDWGLFPASGKQFNLAAREGGRTSKRTLSNTILFFDPHGVERPDKGWRRQRTVGYCAVEVEHEGEGRWVYGAAATCTPNSAHPFYYALPATLEQVAFLEVTPKGQAPLEMQAFRAANDTLINSGGAVFNASQAEDYNRLVARRLLNIEGADWQRRYDALYDVLHRMLGLRVDDALVADPSGVVREFLPVVDRPHLERLVEGLEGIQRIHRDIEEYAKLRATLAGVVEARKRYHEAVLQHGALSWLRAAWTHDDSLAQLAAADDQVREAESAARTAEAEEEAAYAEEHAARRELEALQQLHQGEVVQAVSRANETLTAAQHAQDRAARELRQAQERLQRSEAAVASARHSLNTEREAAVARLTALRQRAMDALGALPNTLSAAWAGLIAEPGDQNLGDALHAAWVEGDHELAGFEARAKRIEGAVAATASARQAERDARAQHEASARAVQTGRQALWARWDKMVQRWPAGIGEAPTNEPSTMVLSPLGQTCQQQADHARAEVREASARAAKGEVQIAELEARLAAIEQEIGQTQTEPLPALSPERERALARLQGVDRGCAPVYRHLDLAREGAAWGEAIEGLLEHLDVLTLLTLSVPVEHARAALGNEADWHVLAASPAGGRAQRGSLASVLVTGHPDLRRYLDGAFGSLMLAQDPPRGGDFLCPDGRYRLGDVTGTVRRAKRSEALIGVVRRQAAAAARRDELTRERADQLARLTDQRDVLRVERETMQQAEARARSLSELAHMLEELDQRRGELRTLREAEESATMRLSTARRTVEDATAEEEDERLRWAEATAAYPALADPAQLARARTALAQAVADTVSRAGETRGRMGQLHTRLRSAEDSHDAEGEAFGVARAQMEQADQDVQEAQRLLNQARSALHAAGLQNVEARITMLQRRLKEAEEQARQTAVARGIATHQLAAARQARQAKASDEAGASAHLQRRNQAFAALLNAVADSLDLPDNQVDDPVRYARGVTRGRDSRQRLDDDLPRAFSAAEREQNGFLVVVAEYAALVGSDERFGLRPPVKRELALAPQGWLLDVAPRMEGTSDVRLLLNFLDVTIEQLQQTLAERVTRVVRDIILGEVVSHLVEQLTRAQAIIEGLNERLANARFFARNTRFSLKLSVRLARLPDIPFDHVSVATALLEHGRAMPAAVQGQLTAIFAGWLDEQMKGQAQPSVEALVDQLDYRRWVDISLLHSDDLDPRVRPWDSAVSGFGSGGEQRVPVYVLLLTAAAMQFAVSNAPLRLLMHDEAFARMDQRNADLVIRFAQQLGMGLVIASPNLDLFAEGVSYATAYRLRQLPSGLIAREALHLRSAALDVAEDAGSSPLSAQGFGGQR
ncbi:MAG TPA: SbcC/MukB-like Walker B domain-containing protein [Ktedonobacterales bacterium]|nr:SbcC/MukB-like Walker B domain-containing protein [Ktedonobacterales bacterium]